MKERDHWFEGARTIHIRLCFMALLVAAGAVVRGDNPAQSTQPVFYQAWSVPAGSNLHVRIPSE
jgi:hypothetical protein